MTIERSCRDLLLAVVRNPGDSGEIRALAEDFTPWDELVTMALQHGVLPMLFAKLADMGDAVPVIAADRVRREYERMVLHNLANAAELISVLELFSREGIQAMPFKGVILAAAVYGNIMNRPAGDLDVLLHQGDLRAAAVILDGRGYVLETPVFRDGRPKDPNHHEYTFRRQDDGIELELRWQLDLNWGRYGRKLGLEWAWQTHSTANLAGVPVPSLNPEASLLVLCMHGSKHDWSRLIWVCDVARTIEAYPDIDWNFSFGEAKRLGLRRALGLGVLLSKRMLAAPVPSSTLQRIEADLTICKLADHFAGNLIGRPGARPSGRLPHSFRLLDFRERLRYVSSKEFLQPNERDRAVFGLPEPLTPLYYLLRPFRLLWDRSAR